MVKSCKGYFLTLYFICLLWALACWWAPNSHILLGSSFDMSHVHWTPIPSQPCTFGGSITCKPIRLSYFFSICHLFEWALNKVEWENCKSIKWYCKFVSLGFFNFSEVHVTEIHVSKQHDMNMGLDNLL